MVGFRRQELRTRYDVPAIQEDEWHSYSGKRTDALLQRHFTPPRAGSACLNAGSGSSRLAISKWKETSLDLFVAPLRDRSRTVCSNVETLPFAPASFDGLVCTGEVLGYCDPAMAIREFARVLAPGGVLFVDFESSRSFRRLLSRSFGRAATMVIDQYNGAPERVWIYDPQYMLSILRQADFTIERVLGTHTWSALARRLGSSGGAAVRIQTLIGANSFATAWADLVSVVAVRTAAAR